MGNLLASSRNATIVSASILAAAAILGAAQAATDSIYKYSTVKVGSFTIDNMAVSPKRSPAVDFANSSVGGAGLSLPNGGSECFQTGVHLPQGSTVNTVKVHYRSNAVDGIFAALYRQDLATGARTALGAGFFEDASNTRRADTMPLGTQNLVVNNHQYAYALEVCVLGASKVFYGARVAYTYTHAGD